MSNDPSAITGAIADAEDAFEQVPVHGRPEVEDDIVTDEGWQVQLTKGCQLLDAARTIREHDGHYTAVIELCFGTIERSIEAWLINRTGDEPEDFDDHHYVYRRADQAGLFQGSGQDLASIYHDNRNDSYYANQAPTDEQAQVMFELAQAVHDHIAGELGARHCTC